jgi:hypothetical protein
VPAASVTFETIPQRLYHPQPPDERERFDAYGDYIYVAAENSGLAVIRLPESGPLGRAYFPSAVH